MKYFVQLTTVDRNQRHHYSDYDITLNAPHSERELFDIAWERHANPNEEEVTLFYRVVPNELTGDG